MKCYKYKDFTNLEIIKEIINDSTLYMPYWYQLQDKDELTGYLIEKNIGKLYGNVKMVNFVTLSLATTFRSKKMWDEYAGSKEGICIEIEIDESKYKILNTIYTDKIVTVDIDENDDKMFDGFMLNFSKIKIPDRILLTKQDKFNFEKEVRIYQEVHHEIIYPNAYNEIAEFDEINGYKKTTNIKHYTSIKITKIFLGPRIKQTDFDFVKEIANEKSIVFERINEDILED